MAKKYLRPVHCRFNTISSVYGLMQLEQYKEPEQFDMPYIVDTSSFIPMSEAVKKVTGRMPDPATVRATYDFPDGNGTADKIPVDRTHRFTGDIAEVSVDLRAKSAIAKKSLTEAYEQYQTEMAYQKAMADAEATAESSNSQS